jgi:isopenicillin N synthase-like dioxygenase
MKDLIPAVELDEHLTVRGEPQQCRRVAHAFEQYGALLVRDPRVDPTLHDRFLDMMERYFDQSDAEKSVDIRAAQYYQVGLTPEFIEHPRDHSDKIAEIPERERPIPPTGADAKLRFCWRIGDRPTRTGYPEMAPDNIEPAGFPAWRRVMDAIGAQFLETAYTVAEMLSVGMGGTGDTFTSRMRQAPHLLDPTGSDLRKNGKLNTVLAGFHYDLNFLSVHGRPRFPGLSIWTRKNVRVSADVPSGYLLFQAGRQLEYLTGGRVHNGFHQVVVTKDTLEAVEEARRAGRPLWRVSSTFFAHIASDEPLDPIRGIAAPGVEKDFPPKLAGELVREELELLRLAPQRHSLA